MMFVFLWARIHTYTQHSTHALSRGQLATTMMMTVYGGMVESTWEKWSTFFVFIFVFLGTAIITEQNTSHLKFDATQKKRRIYTMWRLSRTADVSTDTAVCCSKTDIYTQKWRELHSATLLLRFNLPMHISAINNRAIRALLLCVINTSCHKKRERANASPLARMRDTSQVHTYTNGIRNDNSLYFWSVLAVHALELNEYICSDAD